MCQNQTTQYPDSKTKATAHEIKRDAHEPLVLSCTIAHSAPNCKHRQTTKRKKLNLFQSSGHIRLIELARSNSHKESLSFRRFLKPHMFHARERKKVYGATSYTNLSQLRLNLWHGG